MAVLNERGRSSVFSAQVRESLRLATYPHTDHQKETQASFPSDSQRTGLDIGLHHLRPRNHRKYVCQSFRPAVPNRGPNQSESANVTACSGRTAACPELSKFWHLGHPSVPRRAIPSHTNCNFLLHRLPVA